MLDQLPRVGRQVGERAHANGQFAQGPLVLETHHGDRHGPSGATRRRFGHDAEADVAFDHAAHRVEAAELHPQFQRLADAARLVCEKALQGAGAVKPNEVVAEHVAEADIRSRGEGVSARHHEDETVAAERIGLEPARVHRARHDADIADPFGDEADDFVAEPLLKVDGDLRMVGQKGAQGLGQELGERVGVGQELDLAGEPARIAAEVLAQALRLRQDGARMLEQGAPGRGRRHALAPAHQERGAD